MARFLMAVNSNPTFDHVLIKKTCAVRLGHHGPRHRPRVQPRQPMARHLPPMVLFLAPMVLFLAQMHLLLLNRLLTLLRAIKKPLRQPRTACSYRGYRKFLGLVHKEVCNPCHGWKMVHPRCHKV
jgi:hypothetical protein